MKLNDENMKKLIPYFERNENNCAKIAEVEQMSKYKVLTYFSIYLRDLARNSEAAKVDARFENKPSRCPTCGRLKEEVTDMAVCRDVFHYI